MLLSVFFVTLSSCETQKKVTIQSPQVKKSVQEATVEVQKTPIIHQGDLLFFKENIAPVGKNDNTMSYGSVVVAKPQGFTVTHTHFPSLGQGFRQRYIILHYTALNNDASIRVLTKQSVSAHYLVNDLEDNEIYQLVDENKRAYHAGISYWRGVNNLNDSSIGIEIVNQARDVEGGYEFPDFPEHQVRKVAELVKDIAMRYQIPPQNILAHSDIAPSRKQDPGPKFPWKKLYTDYGIGMWYDEITVQNIISSLQENDFASQSTQSTFIYQYQMYLRDFGYNITPNGVLDNTTKRVITAFQYRFRPQKYDGIMDMETLAILQALIQKYPHK